jgi:hypothetical protein
MPDESPPPRPLPWLRCDRCAASFVTCLRCENDPDSYPLYCPTPGCVRGFHTCGRSGIDTLHQYAASDPQYVPIDPLDAYVASIWPAGAEGDQPDLARNAADAAMEQVIRMALHASEGNATVAAARLGTTRRKLNYFLRRRGLIVTRRGFLLRQDP